jgi:hypothetical protein
MMTDEVVKKKRGRKPGVKMTPKIKLKHNPKTAREDFLKKYKDEIDIGFYGMDEYAYEIINHLWENPEKCFYATDSNKSRLDNANRYYGQRSFSMYRWNICSESGFIETPQVDVILVSKDCLDNVKDRPNPYNVKLIVLEEI